MPSARAIALFGAPSTISASTSRSRGLSRPAAPRAAAGSAGSSAEAGGDEVRRREDQLGRGVGRQRPGAEPQHRRAGARAARSVTTDVGAAPGAGEVERRVARRAPRPARRAGRGRRGRGRCGSARPRRPLPHALPSLSRRLRPPLADRHRELERAAARGSRRAGRRCPTASGPSRRASSRIERSGSPSHVVTMSPTTKPAAAAGPSSATSTAISPPPPRAQRLQRQPEVAAPDVAVRGERRDRARDGRGRDDQAAAARVGDGEADEPARRRRPPPRPRSRAAGRRRAGRRASIRPPAALVQAGPAAATIPKAAQRPVLAAADREHDRARPPAPPPPAGRGRGPVSARSSATSVEGSRPASSAGTRAAVRQRGGDALVAGEALLGGDDQALGPEERR